MKHELISLILIILLTGTYALSCYHCAQGSITINGEETKFPHEFINCTNSTNMYCDEEQVSCISGSYIANMTEDKTANTSSTKLQVRNSANITDGEALCKSLESKMTGEDGLTLSFFKCQINVCLTDNCNSGGIPDFTKFKNTGSLPEIPLIVMGALFLLASFMSYCIITLYHFIQMVKVVPTHS